MENKLYLECNSGISGDMFVASLLDLGADQVVLMDALNSLSIDGFEIKISTVQKGGVYACDFAVILEEAYENKDHNMEYLHGKKEPHFVTHKDASKQRHNHHRNLSDILSIIEKGKLTQRAKELSCKIFQIIAKAEAKAHHTSIEEVHFHEVGAIDSIIDIVAAAVCLDNLGIKEVIVSSIKEGKGMVRCQHGMLSIPVPAVANIVAEYQLPLHRMDVEGEFVTPTGVAIIAAICTKKQLPQQYNILKCGIGAGKRTYEQASILRAVLISE